jgi:phosphatidylserine synthase
MSSVPAKAVDGSAWRHLPAAMVGFRLAIGPMMVWDALDGSVTRLFLAGVVLGPLSDLLDGMIARRLGVDSRPLREADSWVDTAFYLCVAACVWLVHRAVIVDFRWPLLAILGSQVACWVVEWARFRHLAAYHAYTAKFWGLALFIATFSLFAFDYAGICFGAMVVMALIALAENMAITLVLPRWTHDVWSVREAWQIRQGRADR